MLNLQNRCTNSNILWKSGQVLYSNSVYGVNVTATHYIQFRETFNLFVIILRSSLFYNTSARHEQHECDMNDTSATQVRHKRHE